MSEFAATEAPAPVTLDAPAAPEPASVGDALGQIETPAEPTMAPAEPAAQAFDPTELYGELAYLREQLAQQQAAPQPGGTPGQQTQGFDTAQLFDEYGQLRPDAFVQYQQARDTAMLQAVQEMFQPVSQTLEQQQQQATQQHYATLVDTVFSDNIAKHGDFVPAGSAPEQQQAARTFVEERAGSLLGDLNQRFGTNPDGTTKPHVLEMAISQAAADVRGLLGAAGAGAAQQQASHLATLAGAPVEPGSGASGAAGGPPQFKTKEDIVAYYSRNGAGFPQG